MSRTALADSPAVRAGSPARAVVHAGGVDTEYLRAGQGEPMVLVAALLDSSDVQATVARLAQHYLVLAVALPPGSLAQVQPQPGPAGNPLANRWLDEFLEGLGLSHAHVLLHSSLPEHVRLDIAVPSRA